MNANLKFLFDRKTTTWVGLGLILILLAGAGAWYVYDKHQWALARIDELEPRYARMLGLKKNQQALTTANADASAVLAYYTYGADQDASKVGNDAQQRLSTLFALAGLTVTSSQILPAKSDKFFEKIPMTVRLEGELAGVQAALSALAAQSPGFFVEGFQIQTIGFVRAEVAQKLALQINLFVLRNLP